ncbi:hypothetical protein ASA1KI_21190 [Opitutales bacterium ASA1]|uniref:phage virion morphogenesis protein n=1 Tax=Congregicoccus parvus TaxID=3081749 RepID=UPI002B2F8738|nr:hypothetical protein ASA1KI_21190 [Opitutales bacterium ASA1]
MLVHDTISPQLAAMARRVANPTPIVEAMGQELANITQRSFREPGMRAAPWVPLRPSTLAAKGGAGGILRGPSAVLARSWRVQATATKATVSTDRPYAAHHQFGTRPYVIRPKNKKALRVPGVGHPIKKVNHPGLPARPMLPLVGGSPATARLAPFAERRIQRIGQRKLEAMLRSGM